MPAQTIPFSAGLVVLCNDKVLLSSDPENPPVLEPNTVTGTQYFKYQYRTSALASYLEMRVYATDTAGLLAMFCYNTNEAVGKFNQFAVKNVQLKFHASLYADDYLFDFYVASFDQIEAAYPVYKKALLYNGYTIDTPAPEHLRFGVVNYYSGTSQGNTGEYFPTVLRVAGYFD